MTLIEYAVFFGSIEIFQFLRLNNIELKPSLWFYAIHGDNAEMIHLLEEYLDKPNNKLYKQYYAESIKCHHNKIANYFQNNYVKEKDVNSHESIILNLKHYNFFFISDDLIKKYAFCDFCKYDYYFLATLLINDTNINAIRIIYFNII